MSNITKNDTINTPTGAVFDPNRPSKVFIIYLAGNLTGDMWHNAAATALAKDSRQNKWPVTMIGVNAYTAPAQSGGQPPPVPAQGGGQPPPVPAQGGGQVVPLSYKGGRSTFEYIFNIDLPIFLVKIDATKKVHHVMAMLVLPKYKSKIDELTTCFETYFQDGFERFWTALPVFSPPVSTQRSTESIEVYNNKIATTFITKHFQPNDMIDISSLPDRLASLLTAERTGSGHNFVEQADKKFAIIKGHVNALTNNNKDAKMVLFNYREGDVNKQHDGNIDLFTQVIKLTEAKNPTWKVLAIIVGLQDKTGSKLKAIKDTASANNCPEPFVLYDDDIKDKRYTPKLWSLVAKETGIFGLIGGRSGSMDIASFVGVNCASWDEPIFSQKANGDQKYPPKYVSQQGTQYVRLLNQSCVTSILHLVRSDTDQHDATYTAIEPDHVTRWLDREGKHPASGVEPITPELTVDNVNVKDHWNSIVKAKSQMELHSEAITLYFFYKMLPSTSKAALNQPRVATKP